jgi:hypothetical protein
MIRRNQDPVCVVLAADAGTLDVFFPQRVQVWSPSVLACWHFRLKVNPCLEFRVTNADERYFSEMMPLVHDTKRLGDAPA